MVDSTIAARKKPFDAECFSSAQCPSPSWNYHGYPNQLTERSASGVASPVGLFFIIEIY